MTPIEYLNSLIEGQKMSSIPVQLSELEFLMRLLKAEANKTSYMSKGDSLDGPMIKMFRDD